MKSEATRRFDPQQLEQEVGSLERMQRIAFMLSIAERFYPYYFKFSQQEGWGEPQLLRTGIDEAWSTLAGQSRKVDLRQLSDAILKVCPDTERFEGPNVGMALAACSTTVYLLWFIESDALENVVQSAQAAADAVDGYVGWLMFPDYTGEDTRQMWEQRLEHDLTQSELRRQRDDIHLLRQMRSIDAGTLNELRTRWTENAVGGG